MACKYVVWSLVLILLLGGCGPDTMKGDAGTATETGSTDATGSTTANAPEGSAFAEADDEYAVCGPPHHPNCVNLECGVDADTSKYVAMLVEEIKDAGVADRIRLSDANLYPDTQQFLFSLQAQVAWYRIWTPSQIDTSDPDDKVRADFRNDIDNLAAAMPTDIIERELVVMRAAECEGMVYELCTGHVSPGAIHFVRETGDPCAGGSTDEFSINLVSGESMCIPDAVTSC